MEKAVKFLTLMNGPNPDHPSEDSLERFLLNRCEVDELEIVETHIFACEACVTRLETLELTIEATKLALQNLQIEQAAKIAHSTPGRAAWLRWLTLPRLTFAGAALAACTFAISFVSVPRDVTLVANRGDEITQASVWLPIYLHLYARDLPSGPLSVDIVDAQGTKVWEGEATVQKEKINVKAGRLTTPGQYFVRVFSQSAQDADSGLLREYSIQAKPLF
jgi:hypothetical protein